MPATVSRQLGAKPMARRRPSHDHPSATPSFSEIAVASNADDEEQRIDAGAFLLPLDVAGGFSKPNAPVYRVDTGGLASFVRNIVTLLVFRPNLAGFHRVGGSPGCGGHDQAPKLRQSLSIIIQPASHYSLVINSSKFNSTLETAVHAASCFSSLPGGIFSGSSDFASAGFLCKSAYCSASSLLRTSFSFWLGSRPRQRRTA